MASSSSLIPFDDEDDDLVHVEAPSTSSFTTSSQDSAAFASVSLPAFPSINHVSFNQDRTCFVTGLSNGFRVFRCDPFQESFRREFQTSTGSGGIGLVEMLYGTKTVALVGKRPNPPIPLGKVIIWDNQNRSRTSEIFHWTKEIRAVRINRERIAVVLDQKILVHSIEDLTFRTEIETGPNPMGLCELSQGVPILVCPGEAVGYVRVKNFEDGNLFVFQAHESPLAALELSIDGMLLATASSKGTLIRIFSTNDGTRLLEVRRGKDRADINSLALSSDSKWLAASSSKGTIHVFFLNLDIHSTTADRPSSAPESSHDSPTCSSLSLLRNVLPNYFSLGGSLAQFRLSEGCKYIVAFGHRKNTVVILGMDGSFHRCEFDPLAGGEMRQLEFHNFLDMVNHQ